MGAQYGVELGYLFLGYPSCICFEYASFTYNVLNIYSSSVFSVKLYLHAGNMLKMAESAKNPS